MGRVKQIRVLGPLCQNEHRHEGTDQSMRYASTRQCVVCHKAWLIQYSRKPRVRKMLRQRAIKYHYKNRKARLEYMRRYHKTDNYKAAVRKFRKRNRVRLADGCREWREANKDKVKAYDKWYKNTERGAWIYKHMSMARRRIKKQRRIPYTSEQLRIRMKRFKGRCMYCGSTDRLAVDHLVALALSGWDCLENFVQACRNCNSSKNRKFVLTWYRRQEFFKSSTAQRIDRLLIRYCITVVNWRDKK